jgi:hypothetical protein
MCFRAFSFVPSLRSTALQLGHRGVTELGRSASGGSFLTAPRDWRTPIKAIRARTVSSGSRRHRRTSVEPPCLADAAYPLDRLRLADLIINLEGRGVWWG